MPAAARAFWAAALLGSLTGAVSGQNVEGEFYYLLRRTRGVGINTELRGTYSGTFQVALSPSSEYELWVLERGPEQRIGSVVFTTGPDGSRQSIPRVPLRTPLVSHDADGDALYDQSEAIIGSNPLSRDTDQDGAEDLGEFLSGASLTEVTAARTGIVGTVDTPGLAQDVQVNNELCVVADGQDGVVCFNVFNTLPAAIVARVDTPGQALRVAVGDTLVGVADGSGGFHVIDVSDPPAAAIARSVPAVILGGNAECVAVVGGVALVGLSTGVLASVDMASGDVIERVQVGAGGLTDVVVARDALYVIDGRRLFALALRPGELQVAGSVDAQVNFPAVRLFVGGGVAYVTHAQGVNTFSLDDPLQPTLIQATVTPQFGWKHFVADGSGGGLAATGDRSDLFVTHDVSLFDASDPTRTNDLLATFPTPGAARSVALYNGLCYCADNDAGLQVIAYQPADRSGVAPTVSLSTNYAPITQAEEGQLLRITAAAADDVAVRNCELWVNGIRQSTDGAFPYEFFLVTPLRAVRPTISVRVRVSDLGGNFTWSDELVIELVPDQRPPMLTRVVPAPGGVLGRAGGVAAFTNEVLDPATVTAMSLTLHEAGPDRVHGTGDDVVVAGAIEVRPEVKGMFLNVPGDLPPGRYRGQLGGQIADLAGNPLAPFSWTFVVYGTGPGTDLDGDLLSDELEVFLGYDPTLVDSNGNSIPDGDEDFDGDTVSNRLEVLLGFDLTSPDSDGNMVPDALEDRDFDLLPDALELGTLGTSIFDVDTDQDQYPDGDEVQYSSDPLDPLSIPVRLAGIQVCVLSEADPAHAGGRAVLPLSLRNDVDPAHTLGRARVQLSALEQAAPDAVAGATISPPTSVENE